MVNTNEAYALDKVHNLKSYYQFDNKTSPCAFPITNFNNASEAGSSVSLGHNPAGDAEYNSGGAPEAQCGVTGLIGKAYNMSSTGNIHRDLFSHDFANGTRPYAWLDKGTTAWTFNIWVREKTGPNNFTPILYWEQPNILGTSSELYIDLDHTTNRTNFYAYNNAHQIIFNAFYIGVVLTDDTWHMYTYQWNHGLAKNQTKIFIDSVIKKQVNESGVAISDSANSVPEWFVADIRGKVDEASFWNTQLTQSDITFLYNNTKGVNLITWNGGLSPSFSLSPTNQNIGGTVTLKGNGFGVSKTMTFKFDGTILTTSPATVTTNATGGFSATFTVPSASYGGHTVSATDGTSTLTATLTVQSPSFFLSFASGTPGTFVTMKGNGYHASSKMTFYYDGNPLTTNIATVTTNSTGGFNGIVFDVPQSEAGSHAVSAVDASAVSLVRSFLVVSGLTISPVSGPSGVNLNVNGSGYIHADTITVKFAGSTVKTLTSNGLGSFTTNFAVPIISTGSKIVNGSDTHSDFATQTFIVTANATVVSDLRVINVTESTVTLGWSQPSLGAEILKGYQINYTTPHGTPLTVIINNTGSSQTIQSVIALANGTDYSFRVGVWTNIANHAGGNIVDTRTLNPLNQLPIIPGQLQLNLSSTNPVQIPIQFQRLDLNKTSLILFVTYPNNFNLACNFNYKFENVNKTYTNLSAVPVPPNRAQSSFQFNGVSNEIIFVKCYDQLSNATGFYLITQTSFPFQQQIADFRAGKFGTSGQFGVLDIITLGAIILSMIGFSRTNEAAGVMISVVILGMTAYFQIITWPSIITGAIAMVILIAVISTKKLPWSGD